MKVKNQRGQFALEAVLLMVISMSLLLFAIKSFRENQILAKLVESPWDYTAGMIETGTWYSPMEAKKRVPYQHNRFFTPHSY